LRPQHGIGIRAEARRLGLTRLRVIEIAAALLLTLSALLFVGLAIWATDEYEMGGGAEAVDAPAK
jgi:hypothetical protein